MTKANGVMAFLCWAAALLISFFFIWLLLDIVTHGWSKISWAFLIQEPEDAGRAGGIGSILVSTGLIVGIAMLVTLPMGLATAYLLSEHLSGGSSFERGVRMGLDLLAGTPSIVFGLFGNALFCKALGMGFSILSGGLTLACMILPLVIRATEEGLRSVPHHLRLGAQALGLSKPSSFFSLLLPMAAPGLLVGTVLGLGRAMAETAALIFTSGYVSRFPTSLLDSGRSLSIHIFDLSMNVAGGNASAFASSLVLVGLLFLINTSSLFLTERFLHKKVVPL